LNTAENGNSMGKTSTSFKPGNPGKPKGAKHKTTLLKESLGLKNWDKLVSFVNNEAAEKLVDEMAKLHGKDFIYALTMVAEYVKPKLQRTTVEGNPNRPVNLSILLDKLPLKIKKQILDQARELRA
jgi:hypothetical protein